MWILTHAPGLKTATVSFGARAIIRLDALRHNLASIRAQLPDARVMAVVKANGYGHGAVPLAQALGDEADAFGVACCEEASELREAGVNGPILLLEGVFDPGELEQVEDLELQPVLHSQVQVDWLLQARPARPLTVWITGATLVPVTVNASVAVSSPSSAVMVTVAVEHWGVGVSSSQMVYVKVSVPLKPGAGV